MDSERFLKASSEEVMMVKSVKMRAFLLVYMLAN